MRLRNIDLLRGIVMVIMCIDHARDYTLFHPADPMDLSNTSLIVYVLRILAHFCAPTFILLAGISARLSGKRRTRQELSSFLLTRGAILCLLEFTLVNWAWSFNPFYKVTYLQVIWAIGISMIVLSQLVRLREIYIFMIAIILISCHNLLDGLQFAEGTPLFYIWSFLEQKNMLAITSHWSVRTTYPLIPVIGVMALGYVAGKLYTEYTPEKRSRYLKMAGFTCFGLFILFRIIIGYGDPHAVEWNNSPEYVLLSIFNVTKYPLSFNFLMMTLTGSFLFLGFTDGKSYSEKNMFVNLGQVPMFFYILHIYVLHLIALIILVCDGIKPDLINNLGGMPLDWGFPLWYLIWIVPTTVLILLPLCRKYHQLKISKKYKWTNYI